jgi:hypothetical protein
MNAVLDFVREQGFGGTVFHLIIAGWIVYFIILIVHRSKELPEEAGRVTYYKGRAELQGITDGILTVEGASLVFGSVDHKKEYFRVPLSGISDVTTEDVELGPYTHMEMPGVGGLTGWLRYLYIHCRNDRGEKQTLMFAGRSKEGRIGKLRQMILSAVRSEMAGSHGKRP